MNEDSIIHVTVEDATRDELRQVRNFMEDGLEDYEGHGKIIVSDHRMNVAEIPQLDEYIDEIADRVADKLPQQES